MLAEFKLQMQLFSFSKLIIITDVESNILNAFWDGDLACIEFRICLHQQCPKFHSNGKCRPNYLGYNKILVGNTPLK